MSVRSILGLLLLLSAVVLPASAQQGVDPNVNIIWPLPVYSVSGSFAVFGTANAAGMTSYFLEIRPLIDPLTTADASVPWSPAMLPSRTPIINGVLGMWDTTTVADGLYELRLTVLTSDNQVKTALVSPLRVINNPPPFAITPTVAPPPVFSTAIPPTQAPLFQPTAVSQSPVAIAVIDANVRSGDGTIYPSVGALLQGQSALMLGISARGTGWWLIQLPDGRQGWIAPSTVQITGNVSNLPLMSPPATPTPTFTPTPIATALPRSPTRRSSTCALTIR